MKYVKNIRNLIDWCKSLEEPLYLVGAGNNGNELCSFLLKNGISPEAAIDLTLKAWNQPIKIMTYNDIRRGKGVYLITTSVDIYLKKMIIQLYEKGIAEEQIVYVENKSVFEEIYEANHDVRKHISKIKKFENYHKGESCFVIGNGPSLCAEDLEKIQGIPSFGLNYIFAMYNQTNWRATYYGTFDHVFPRIMWKKKESIQKMLNIHEGVFVSSRVPETYKYRNDSSMEKLYYLRMKSLKDYEYTPDKIDCSEFVFSGATSIMVNIQLAMYMGFEEIYLLGVDMQVQKLKETKVYYNKYIEKMYKENVPDKDERINKGAFENSIEEQKRFFCFLKRYSDKHNISIYNATRGGALEVFPRIDLGSIVN